MGKKKGKKGKAKVYNPDVLHEVDKAFYELQIVDLNRKLARLRSYSTELEEKVIILEQVQGKTEADRADVISYLKRTLQEKTAEVLELQERVVFFEAAQESNEEKHQEEIRELKAEYESMREQLISDLKQITGKLNALEEFRLQRDDLMSKFEIQENQIEEQEIRHKRNMYEVERKFILGKDAIKREMEQQLFTLAKDFERANELRMAATTQRVIRENIVVNNELNKLIYTSEEFLKEITALKAKNKDLSSFNVVIEAERNKALKDFSIQKGIIHQIVHETARLKDVSASQECDIERSKQVEKELKAVKINEEILKDKIRTYEQQLHSIRCDEFNKKKTLRQLRKQISQLKGIIYETLYNVDALMALEGTNELEKRAELFTQMSDTLRKVSYDIAQVESQNTLLSSANVYHKGDLGFMFKVQDVSKAKPMHLHAESQVGHSFHDFISKQKEAPAEETYEVKLIPETCEFEYKEISDSSEETIFSTITEESVVSDTEKDVEKEVVLLKTNIQDDVEEEIEEEAVEEEELRSVDSSNLGGF